MLNIAAPLFDAETVMRIARIDRATLANWLRRGLLDRLNSEKEPGKHRRYTAADVVTITAMAQLVELGLQPGRFEDRLASLILSNAMHRYSSRCGIWGEIRPEFENLYRWLAVFHDPSTGERDWSEWPHPAKQPQNGRGVMILIDCHQISDYVMGELEALIST